MTDWNEADHPRAPAGTDNGGQFINKEQGGHFAPNAKAGPEVQPYQVFNSDELDEVDKEKFVNSFEGPAFNYILSAQNLYEARGWNVSYIFRDGEPLAFYQGSMHEDGVFEVHFLGSVGQGSGGGTVAMAEAIKDAASRNARVFYLDADWRALDFYRKMGMHEGSGDTDFFYRAPEIQALAKEIRRRQGK